jgi:photosystem II stability/assembly factor-like uncharacterized protein
MKTPRKSAKRRPNSALAVGTLATVAVVGIVWWQTRAAESVPLSEVSHIHGIAVDTTDSSRLYLATHNGVWRTSPDGTAELISDNSNDYMGFTPHPTEADLFYASGHPVTGGNMGVIVSRDGARTWEQLASGVGGPVDFHSMDVSGADPKVIYGLYGDIQTSRDGGETWELAGSPPADVFDIAASPVNPDVVYAATRSGVMVSLDGGNVWQTTGTEGQPASFVETAPDGTVYTFLVGSGLMSAPAAASPTWKALGGDFGERIIVHLAIDPADPGRMFAVTQESEILTSTDGGQNWKAMTS